MDSNLRIARRLADVQAFLVSSIITPMTQTSWPDHLKPAQSTDVSRLLSQFWNELASLADLVQRHEHLLAANLTASLRQIVLEMMLALNGIAWPHGTQHLNTYLSDSQRAAIEKTLLTPTVSAESWIAQAVALVVIYRWYAPQLVEKFTLPYPHDAENSALGRLHQIPDWPLTITTD